MVRKLEFPFCLLQVVYADLSSFLRHPRVASKPDFVRLTDYPVDIGNVKYHPESGYLAFTAEVYANGSLEDARKQKDAEASRFDTGVVYGNWSFLEICPEFVSRRPTVNFQTSCLSATGTPT